MDAGAASSGHSSGAELPVPRRSMKTEIARLVDSREGARIERRVERRRIAGAALQRDQRIRPPFAAFRRQHDHVEGDAGPVFVVRFSQTSIVPHRASLATRGTEQGESGACAVASPAVSDATASTASQRKCTGEETVLPRGRFDREARRRSVETQRRARVDGGRASHGTMCAARATAMSAIDAMASAPGSVGSV